MKKTLTIGLTAIALTMTGTAFAQQTDGPKTPRPDLTRAQAQTNAEQMFARLDANNDGVLTQADREARNQARRTKAFEALDANKDGQISRDEFMNAKREGKRGEMGKGDRGRKGDRMGWHHRGMKGAAGASKDASITKAQFVASALARFDKLDANKDGTVTAEERKAAREAMRAQWQAKKAEKAN